MPDTALLDIKQAAEFLQVSVTSLRRWTNAGQLPCLRVGNRRERRFRRADLLRFMETADSGAAVADREPAQDRVMVGGLAITHGAHLCAMYEDERGMQELAAPFLREALDRGAACWVLGGPGARRLLLGSAGARAAPAAARITESGYAGSCRAQIDRLEAAFLDAERSGVSELRVVGDVKGFKVSRRELCEYEEEYERHLARRFKVVTLCLYDVRSFKGGSLLDALKTHHDTFRYPPRRWLG